MVRRRERGRRHVHQVERVVGCGVRSNRAAPARGYCVWSNDHGREQGHVPRRWPDRCAPDRSESGMDRLWFTSILLPRTRVRPTRREPSGCRRLRRTSQGGTSFLEAAIFLSRRSTWRTHRISTGLAGIRHARRCAEIDRAATGRSAQGCCHQVHEHDQVHREGEAGAVTCLPNPGIATAESCRAASSGWHFRRPQRMVAAMRTPATGGTAPRAFGGFRDIAGRRSPCVRWTIELSGWARDL